MLWNKCQEQQYQPTEAHGCRWKELLCQCVFMCSGFLSNTVEKIWYGNRFVHMLGKHGAALAMIPSPTRGRSWVHQVIQEPSTTLLSFPMCVGWKTRDQNLVLKWVWVWVGVNNQAFPSLRRRAWNWGTGVLWFHEGAWQSISKCKAGCRRKLDFPPPPLKILPPWGKKLHCDKCWIVADYFEVGTVCFENMLQMSVWSGGLGYFEMFIVTKQWRLIIQPFYQ